ncbi:response regulator, partial [Ideonella sp.]|uniref:response regulator n=1 Tax=Ideonella sp. TaxID=1929293 RepID=UPI003BB72454
MKPAAHHHAKLLVVDDEPANIKLLYRILEAEYQVLPATSGEQALALCHSHRPDLVLLDVLMPGMDGHEVCRRLKHDPQTREIPVIFVTAHDDPQQESLGLDLGAADFIAKPVHAAVLLARLRTHLGWSRSRAVLAATLDATADGILVLDPAQQVLSCNEHVNQVWGLPTRAWAGPARDLLDDMAAHTDDRAAWSDWLSKALSAEPQPVAPLAIALAGDRHIECRASPLPSSGRTGGHVLSFRDVTERRRATLAIEQLNASLEARILERTQALETALSQADVANRAKSDFLANMSHEIRTPINGVIGLTQLALQADPPARQRDYLQKIALSGSHLLGVVNQVLDYSRLEAGAPLLDEVDFELGELLAEVAAQMRPSAEQKGLSLKLELPSPMPLCLRGDTMRLRQVLINYLGNAIKFSASGTVTLRLRAQPGAAATTALCLEVEDHGPGLTAEQCEQLFKPFHQADASITRKHGGSGLGLAICKQLAELMGGSVGVRSEPGRGSTFWLALSLPAGAEPARVDLTPAAEPRTLAGVLVLVVDDNRVNLEVAAGLLEDAGARVQTADNGQEALDALAQQRFDCVLMDVQMPLMDGLEATRRIRRHPDTATLPVIAMTADARPEKRAQCEAAGMSGFMSKPFDPTRLHKAVADCLKLAAAPEVSPAMDGSVLWRSANGKPERAARYVGLFLALAAESKSALTQAEPGRDDDALRAWGHKLKSGGRQVGADALARCCEALEQSAPDSPPTLIAQRVTEVLAALA